MVGKLFKTAVLGAMLATVGGVAGANPIMPVPPGPFPGPPPPPLPAWQRQYGAFAGAAGEVASTASSAAYNSAGQGLGVPYVITTQKLIWRPLILNAPGLTMQDELELTDVIIENHTRIRDGAIRRELGDVRTGNKVRLSHIERGGLLVGDLAGAMCVINVVPAEVPPPQPRQGAVGQPPQNRQGQPPQGQPPQGRPPQMKQGQPPQARSGQPPEDVPPASVVSPSGRYRLIVMVWPKKKDVWGAVGFGNGGYKYTGRYQGTVMANAANLAHEGDVLTVGGLYTGSHERSGMFNYNLPAVGQGTRFNLYYQRTAFDLAGPYRFLGISGASNTASFGYHQNLTRHANHNLYMDLSFTVKKMNDAIYGIALGGQPAHKGDKNSHFVTLGFRGDFTDNWGGGAYNIFGVKYSQGRFDPRGGHAINDPRGSRANGHDTAGNFGKWNFSFSREQKLAERLKLFVGFDAQYSTHDLDSTERMVLGGPLGVRAYPIAEAPGASALLGKLELRWNLPKAKDDKNDWEIISFVDAGYSKINTHPNPGDRINNREIYGWGVGVNWRYGDKWLARVSWARPFGPDDAMTETMRSSRVWFQLYKFF